MMKKASFVLLAIAVAVSVASCGKKQQPLEEMQTPMSIESLSTTTSTEAKTTGDIKTPAIQAMTTPESATVAPKLETMPPAGPYKPTVTEIQTALKNAGLYTGITDGKKGPMTKKAVEEFQKANNLEPDGKVGPKTWAVLSKYLNTVPTREKR